MFNMFRKQAKLAVAKVDTFAFNKSAEGGRVAVKAKTKVVVKRPLEMRGVVFYACALEDSPLQLLGYIPASDLQML